MMDYSMNTAPLMVTQAVTVELVGPSGDVTPVRAELKYDASDPYAVTAVFIAGQSQVSWTFAADLLRQGLSEPSGDGDVHVWPCLDSSGRAVVIIELCSPDGEALVQAKTTDVLAFVERVNASVPEGTESAHLDIDSAISAILAAELA
jgi:hypothetical protein